MFAFFIVFLDLMFTGISGNPIVHDRILLAMAGVLEIAFECVIYAVVSTLRKD